MMGTEDECCRPAERGSRSSTVEDREAGADRCSCMWTCFLASSDCCEYRPDLVNVLRQVISFGANVVGSASQGCSLGRTSVPQEEADASTLRENAGTMIWRPLPLMVARCPLMYTEIALCSLI